MFTRQAIPDIILIAPKRFEDERGWFREAFNARRWAEAGIVDAWVQDNESLSRPAGTVRGLHFQIAPMAQAKLIACTAGAILDIAVDIRRASPTFGRHTSVELSAANGHHLYIPEGFAHGFCTLQPDSAVRYKVSRLYDPASEQGIAWDDPDLGIDWKLGGRSPTLSPRDQRFPRLRDLPVLF